MAPRQTLSQRIALTGGKEIEAELKALGKAGEEVFRRLQEAGDAGNSFGAGISRGVARLRADLANVGAAATRFGAAFSGLGRSFGEVGAAAAGVRNRFLLVGGAASGAAVAVLAFAKSTADAIDAQAKQAQGIGFATEAFGRVAFAARMSNLSNEEFVAGMGRISKALSSGGFGKAAQGATRRFEEIGVSVTNAMKLSQNRIDEAKKALSGADDEIGDFATAVRKLGIDLKTFVAASPEKRIELLADGFARMPDSARKTAIAMELFGRAGPKFIAFFNAGGAAIREMGKDFERLHGPLTAQTAQIADELGDSFDRVGIATSGIRTAVLTAIGPALTEAANQFAEFLASQREGIAGFARLIVTNAVPVIRDFFNAFTGNDASVKNGWVIEWRDAIIAFGRGVREAVITVIVPAFQALLSAANGVAAVLNRVFGTEFSGGALLAAAAVLHFLGVFKLLAGSFSLAAAGIKLMIASFGLFSSLVARLVFGIAALARAIVVGIGAAVATFGALPVAIAAGIAAAVAAIIIFWPQISEAAGKAWEAIKAAAAGLWAFLTSLWTAGVGVINSVWSSIVALFAAAVDRIRGLWDGLLGFIRSAVGTVVGWIDGIISAVGRAISAVRRLVSSRGSSDSGGGRDSILRDEGFAGGGRVRGPGSERSDSILAWLSNGEFVVRAAAVKHYGADFLAALNAMRLPKGFNLGGLAEGFSRSLAGSLAIPRFADGGLALAAAGAASHGRPVNLNIGGEVFEMVAGEDVARKLEAFATRKALRAAGRKPRGHG